MQKSRDRKKIHRHKKNDPPGPSNRKSIRSGLMVITVHVTTSFLHPILFYFLHTCSLNLLENKSVILLLPDPFPPLPLLEEVKGLVPQDYTKYGPQRLLPCPSHTMGDYISNLDFHQLPPDYKAAEVTNTLSNASPLLMYLRPQIRSFEGSSAV